MTVTEIEAELASMQEKFNQLKHDLILTDGAIQALMYVKAKLEAGSSPTSQADGDEGAEVLA